MKRLINKYYLWRHKRQMNDFLARRRKIWQEIHRDINVTEFDGKMYVSYQGQPIIPVGVLQGDLPSILETARKKSLQWLIGDLADDLLQEGKRLGIYPYDNSIMAIKEDPNCPAESAIGLQLINDFV